MEVWLIISSCYNIVFAKVIAGTQHHTDTDTRKSDRERNMSGQVIRYVESTPTLYRKLHIKVGQSKTRNLVGKLKK